MTLTDADERSAMRKAINVVAKDLEGNSPRGSTGKLSSIRTSVKKDGFGIVGEAKAGAYYDIFMEFGTSYQKAHVGYFDRSVEGSSSQAYSILVEELLKNVK